MLKPITRLIKGPRPLHPKSLKAFWELCPNPITGYWNMLNDKAVLIKPVGNSAPVAVPPITMISLVELHAHGVHVMDINSADLTIKFKIDSDYLTARYGKTSDFLVLKETYFDKLYDGDYHGNFVIDVGGYIGETALFFAQRGARRVFCVEPAPDNFRLLEQNISQSSFKDKIVVVRAAILDKDGIVEFYMDNQNYPCHHVANSHEFMKIYATDTLTYNVQAMSFQSLMEYTGLEEVDVVKLDCEGSEYDILLGTPDSVLKRVRKYIIEYHNGPDVLVKRLDELGYKVRGKFRGGVVGLLYAERK
jgi:FkbM family methyltransferase